MYASSYARSASTMNSVASSAIWIIVSLVLAIVGGIVLYFTFLKKDNEGKYTLNMVQQKTKIGWMYDFLTFKKLTIENVLKILYLICAIFVTLSSFATISTSFIAFLLYLVVGNLVVRIAYELILVRLIICRNTTEINKKLDKKD